MAEGSDMEKTEEPSPRRLEEAREKGDVAYSRELATVTVFFASLLYFAFMQNQIFDTLRSIMVSYLSFDKLLDIASDNVGVFLFNVLLKVVPILFPLLGLVFIMGLLANIGQVGFMVSTEKISPDFSRLNPVSGIKRIVSMKNIVEGFKTIMKFLIVGGIAYITLRQEIVTIIRLADSQPDSILNFVLQVGLRLTFRVAILMLFFSGFDYFYQRYEYRKGLRMTRQELKEEMKDREGNPLIKQRIKSLQMEAARQRMMTEVPKADVVITNPTHYAVALKYEFHKMKAPVVVAKGADLIAKRIRELAEEHSVPIIENPYVAQALYKSVKIGKVIPPTLFKAIAEILAYVYKISKKASIYSPN